MGHAWLAVALVVSATPAFAQQLDLLALSGLMQSDPETALPVIEKMLAGSSSMRVKDRALFVVSQSRSARARTLMLGVARGNSNPDLQLKAVGYISQMGGAEAAQALDEVYRATTDERIRREVIRGFGSSGAQNRLVALYAADQSEDVRRAIIDSLAESNGAAALVSLARNETDGALKQVMVRRLANMTAPPARAYMMELLK